MTPPSPLRLRGQIAATGTASGTRVVVGRWLDSPWGAFVDVMLAEPDGTRTLLSPTMQVAELVAGLHTFDEVEITPVTVTTDRATRTWQLHAGPLRGRLELGGPTSVGRLLGLVPEPLATAAWFGLVTDPVARRVLPGIRTRGRAGGYRESYGATGQVRIVAATVVRDGTDLGAMAPVVPPLDVGFSSVPPTPTVTSLVTTLRPVR